MDLDSKIYVAGHKGMVGSAIIRILQEKGYTNLICRSSKELNLTNQSKVDNFFSTQRPDYVIVAAARVGGISDTIAHPADFLLQNLQMECNVISSAHKADVKKLLFISSAVVYPSAYQDSISEELIMTGKLDEANESYGLSKICGIQLCSYFKKQYGNNFMSVIPCNLYGIGDNFAPGKSHLVAGMIQRFHKAKVNGKKKVDIWGTGLARRELLNSDDLAEAIIMLMNSDAEVDFLNVGYGTDMSIKEIAEIISSEVGYKGELYFDTSKPEGAVRRLLDSGKILNLGWKPRIDFRNGVKKTYEWYIKQVNS